MGKVQPEILSALWIRQIDRCTDRPVYDNLSEITRNSRGYK